jgi:hypothetical protein
LIQALLLRVHCRRPVLTASGRGGGDQRAARDGQADPDSADALLDQAEESYASWPTPRTLTFCDVVHFIAVSEFLASHGETPWIQADMRREVQSLIPRNL